MTFNYYEEAYAKEDLSKCVSEPKIELTLEEAKRVESLMNDLIDLHNKDSIKILASGFETIYMVKHRIEQAGGNDEAVH